jgi:hypothetical protein
MQAFEKEKGSRERMPVFQVYAFIECDSKKH